MKLMSLFISLDLKNELHFAWWSSSRRKYWIVSWLSESPLTIKSLEILDLTILLENVNLTRQVNSILQTQHYELQRVVFSNEELKRQQRDIELVNNEIINPEMEKITFQLDFMQQETLVYNNEFTKTRAIFNDLEDNILQSKVLNYLYYTKT